MMWHIQKEAGFSRQHAHKSGRGSAQTHACLSSVINLVSRNDLTKIVNTITYCDRARPQKNPCQLHFKKTELTLRRKKGSNTAGGGTVWIKRSLFWTRRAAGIRDQVQHFIHTHTHKRRQHDSHLFLHHFPFFSLHNRASKSSQSPAYLFFLSIIKYSHYYGLTSALASIAGQLEELVLCRHDLAYSKPHVRLKATICVSCGKCRMDMNEAARTQR